LIDEFFLQKECGCVRYANEKHIEVLRIIFLE
jgi:hypothetical protein